MTIGSDVTAHLPELRAEAESLMLTTCRVVTLVESVDEVTGATVSTETAVHYEGPGKVRFTSTVASDKNSAGQSYTEQSGMLSIPAGAAHSIKINATLLALDRRFRIAGATPQTISVQLRFPLELIS